MPTIIFTDHDGTVRTVEVEAGISLMEAARNNDIPGIVAECGGMCACATCHVYIDEEWFDKLGSRSDTEESMLEFVDEHRTNSRLACQIELSEELDGLEVQTPESQG